MFFFRGASLKLPETYADRFPPLALSEADKAEEIEEEEVTNEFLEEEPFPPPLLLPLDWDDDVEGEELLPDEDAEFGYKADEFDADEELAVAEVEPAAEATTDERDWW